MFRFNKSVEWEFSDHDQSDEELHDIERKKRGGKGEEVITADRARVWEQGDTVGGADLIRNIKKTISFADIGKEGRGAVDTRIYDDTLTRPEFLQLDTKTKLRRNGSLSPSTLPGRKPGVISNNGIPILHELRFGSPTMPPVRRKRSASVPEGLHQLLDRNKQKISWGQVSQVTDSEASPQSVSPPVVGRKSGCQTTQLYVWEVWPVAGSQVRLSNKIPGQDDELPGGDCQLDGKKLNTDPVDQTDSNVKKDGYNMNGTVIKVPDTSSEVENKLAARYEKFEPHSLQRHTSRSSLASIRSKIMRAASGDPKKKPEVCAIQVFVVILFCLCSSIVIAAHVLYNQHIGEVKIFERLRLEDDTRSLVILDLKDKEIMSGHLSVNMPHHLHAYSCLPTTNSPQEPVKCLEWPHRAVMTISRREEESEVTCHRVVTQSLSKEISPCDCWPVGGPGDPSWYGGGESLVSSWPLGHNTLNMTPFVTGDEQKTVWGNVIRKFFINSKGISINVENDIPLSVSLNDKDGPALCFQASYNQFPYYYHSDNLPSLNYTICTGDNINKVYRSQLTPFWEGHKHSDMEVLDDLLEVPLWQVPGKNYTVPVIQNYISRHLHRTSAGDQEVRGYILLDHHWQRHMGDFSFNKKHFQNLSDLQDAVRKAGRRLAITINPFVSVESEHFREGVNKKLFVMERNSTKDKFIPALSWFKDVPLAALLDITNPDTVVWLQSKLTELDRALGGEVAFYLDPGNTFHTPHYFTFAQPLYNPDLYKDHFIDKCMNVVKVIGVSGSISKRPKAPAFVWMSPLDSSWSSLQSIIPNILHLGVIGYPFINPGPIGGSPISELGTEPSKELFIRWWQLATFLPQIHFLTPPSQYQDQFTKLLEMKLRNIRQTVVNPLLKKFAREAMEQSLPLIRPLWMLHPTDENCLTINDQFMVGDSLLVAPVLKAGSNTRRVYLPPAPDGSEIIWKQEDGTFYSGGQWRDVLVPLDRILWFSRQADGARPGSGANHLL